MRYSFEQAQEDAQCGKDRKVKSKACHGDCQAPEEDVCGKILGNGNFLNDEDSGELGGEDTKVDNGMQPGVLCGRQPMFRVSASANEVKAIQ